MSSLYKNNGIWYVSVSHNNKRHSKSLKTKNKRIAKSLELETINSIINDFKSNKKEIKDLNFQELSNSFLSTDHGWSDNTKQLYNYILKVHIEGKPLPINPTSRAIHIRHINQCWNWGLKNNLITKADKIPGDTKGESRNRTFTDNELRAIFDSFSDSHFNAFIRFAYYTGARSGEIRSISTENILDGSLVVRGKTGRRYIKLNHQAKDIIKHQKPIWKYTKDYVSHKFKKEVRKLNIRNARFHDLRRTFGLNLIKQGMSIYKVSKLLGHKSVRTTEQHYAPLLTVEIEDFTL